jgi:hypothetical protein
MQAAIAAWAARNLPARIDVVATAKLLGFAEHDIQILMAVGKLTPLGDYKRDYIYFECQAVATLRLRPILWPIKA